MPPAPSGAAIWYGPSREPAASVVMRREFECRLLAFGPVDVRRLAEEHFG
jgi:hypothetical protein